MRSPILGGWAVPRSLNLADNECINLFPEIQETKDGKAPGALWMTPGLDLLATVGPGPIRGLHVLEDLLYVVSGAEVHSLSVTYVDTLLGTIASGTTPVSMIDNGSQIMINNGQSAWITPGGRPFTGGSGIVGGENYAVDDTIVLEGNGGTQTASAQITVTGVGAGGAVTSFSVLQGGAFSAAPATMVQNTTDGSGSGFQLTSPTFGSFSGLVPITLPFTPHGKAAVLDGFGLSWEQATNKLWQSDNLDLSVWQPLNFAFVQSKPGDGVTLIAAHSELFAFKTTSIEVWIDQGTAGFAFGPLQGPALEVGCVAPFSAARVGEVIIFLSQSDQGEAIVVELKGFAPQPITTQALVNEFQTYDNIGDAIGFGFQIGGHVFYEISFPQANRTWRYDLTASAMMGHPVWHRVTSFGDETASDPSFSGLMNRHWSNVFTRWLGAGGLTTSTLEYCPTPVDITAPERIESAAELANVGATFSSFWYSVNLDLPDDAGVHGIILSNQSDDTLATHNAGLFIKIANDQTATPQITIEAWDASNNAIVSATFDYTDWGTWVNFIISLDTATQTLVVWATTIIAGIPTEGQLSPVAETWSSTNPISNLSGQPWHITPVQ